MKTNDIETVPADPITIPQLEVIFHLPKKWLEEVTQLEISVTHLIDRLVSCNVGHLYPEMKNPAAIAGRIAQVRSGAGRNALYTAMQAVPSQRVSLTIRKDLWDMFTVMAENHQEPAMHLLLHLIGNEIVFRKSTDGQRIRNWCESERKKKSEAKAGSSVAPGRVVAGPWKSARKERAKA